MLVLGTQHSAWHVGAAQAYWLKEYRRERVEGRDLVLLACPQFLTPTPASVTFLLRGQSYESGFIAFSFILRVCKWGSVSLSSPWSTRNYSPSFHQHGTCLPPPPWQFLSPLNLKTRLSFFFFLTEKSFRRWFRWRRGLFSVSIFEINQHIIKCM